ncbi:MAG TPA: ABC transporter substrate-binding protein [Usitatibacter sp.]|nr:ABC transporter substrate-binding protein [Usitatibacter sp.]
MHLHRRLAAGAALLALAFASHAADRIVVGESAPLTGSNAELGKDIRDGALAYFKKVNDAGGVHGRLIELVTLDDHNDRKTAGANAVKLVNESNAVALFGFGSTTLSLDAMPIVKEKRVPFFAPFTGADAIYHQNQYVFAMRASYADELTKVLEHWGELGLTRVTVIHYDDEIGNENYATVERIMKAAGKKPVGVKLLRNKDVTPAQVREIIRSDPEIIVGTTSYASTAAVLKMLHAANHPYSMTTLSFVGPSQLAKVAGADAAGVSVSGVVPPPTEIVVPVVKECGALMRASGLGELNYTNLESCIAAKVLVEAMRRAGPEVTRESLYRGLQSLKGYDAGGYTVTFGPDRRQGSHYVELAVIGGDGKFKY